MITSIKTAYNKLAFAYRVSGSITDFLRLIINSKKYSRSKNGKREDPAIPYQFKPAGIQKKVLLRTYSGDIEIFYEIFWRGIYNNDNINWYHFANIVDLGANVGMTALFFAQKSQATIYAIEPDPDNFSLLTANLSEEISNSRLIPVQAGITNKNGALYLHKKGKAYNSTVSTTEKSGVEVRGITMQTLIREMYLDEIDLLKIDIEGKEKDLLEGDLDWLQIVNNIVMECHSEEIREQATILLSNHGFVVSFDNKGKSYANILWASR